ncbi:PREDICTED: probable NOT transcription complex subunit VIP2 isoform X3 [Tarenaya hassleriana]|uniref:probable NOT transcription complex subunit VIP2 isoform X3 n=1 Tax=Tarenaya hassleriana TaxID=28532 RepID=UPI00053C57A1|nr:PREDICTED: probable NOT transcription complex subunit VIP2 isoform X3 [Tarenaya hassleriana]
MSSLLNSSINGSASNLSDGSGRSFSSSFSGTIQSLHNMHGNFNVPNMAGTLGSRNSGLNSVPSAGIQQPNGNLSNGRFASNNIPVAIAQLSHGSSHGHSGVASRGTINGIGNLGFSSNTNGVGGSIPGILPTSAAIGNRNTVPGLGVSPILGNAGSRIVSSMGNMVGGGNVGRTLSSGGGLSVPGIGSRLNLTANSGSGNLGQNRILGGVLPQGSSQVISMLGNSYPIAGGPLSQNHIQAMNNLSSMGMLNDMNSNENSPFDINNDFPQLTSRPNSAGGPQGQLGSRLKQGLGVSPIVQQNQEFSIQNEDFPALPGYKGPLVHLQLFPFSTGSNADYPMDLHQKEQLHDNSISMMQSQHLSMGRSAGFNLGLYSSHRQQQQQQQQQHAQAVSSGSVSLHGSDMFSSSHPAYHSQTGGHPGIGLRPMNSPNSVSGMGYDQLIQQYQQHQNPSQFRLQQMSAVSQPFRDHGMKSMQSNPDRFGLLGLLSVIKISDPDLTSLALGIDLTTLGLNLNSTENLHKTFGSPWSNEPAKGDPEFSVPPCYYAKNPPPLHLGYFAKFSVETLFYIFYSMPKDEAQLYAANELYNRGWFYHKEHKSWFIRIGEPLVKTNTYERGSYHCFDPNSFEVIRKENFVLHYEMLEKRPLLPQH